MSALTSFPEGERPGRDTGRLSRIVGPLSLGLGGIPTTIELCLHQFMRSGLIESIEPVAAQGRSRPWP